MENQRMLSTQEAVVGGTEGGPRPDWSSARHRGRRRGGRSGPRAGNGNGQQRPDPAVREKPVRGRKMATVQKCRFYLEVAAGIFVDSSCVVDGNLVSGRTCRDNGHFVGPWIRLLEEAAAQIVK